MKVYNCVQGTAEWLKLRAGIPTASCFDKIITPSGKPSAQAEKYMFSLLAERMMGRPIVEHVSYWMDRGNQLEDDAVSWYELQRDCETLKIGFITNEAGTIGASPDRLVGTNGMVEIKVPAEHTHVAYLLNETVERTYYPQVQGQLWVAEDREWNDILSFHPEMPKALIRVERDVEFISMLREAVEDFSAKLEELTGICMTRGWILPPVEQEAAFLSAEDVEFVTQQVSDGPPASERSGETSSVAAEGGLPASQPSECAAPASQNPAAATQPVAPPAQHAPSPPSGDAFISPAQRKRLFALGKEVGLDKEGVKAVVKKCGFDSTSDIPTKLYDSVCTAVRAGTEPVPPPGGQSAPTMAGKADSDDSMGESESKLEITDADLPDNMQPETAIVQANPNALKHIGEIIETVKAELVNPSVPEAPPPSSNHPDEWVREMVKIQLRNPKLFFDKLIGWGWGGIMSVPKDERQGVLEALRAWIK